jgi:UDP-N-acetylglucosamine 1-carboxyvinyltransferase
VIADRIEAGTYLIAGAVGAGDVTVHGLEPHHLELFLTKLHLMGVEIQEGKHSMRASRSGPLRPVDISTLPHPGFPTDLQAQVMVLLSLADGTSIVTENVFENRFVVVDELNRLGAGITTSGHHAVVTSTEIRGAHHIDRGYEGFADKLTALGANVTRVQADETPLARTTGASARTLR